LKQVHSNRYEDPEWRRVAAILIAAKNDHPLHWTKYAELIGGGHPRITLQYWFNKLDKDPFWCPTRDSYGKKNISIVPELKEKIWKRID
jgi:hypothetical protein